MKIAVISETSAVEKNSDIINALAGYGHKIINAGMSQSRLQPELTYIETGLLGAILLNSGRVDFVVGGCGTGQGFLNSIMQYPGVFCGLIQNPLDAWLFAQINGGNCISLALNKGYGWAGDINLKFIFEKLFSVEWGKGYPAHRASSQQESIRRLSRISASTHCPMYEILRNLDRSTVKKVLDSPGITDLLDIDTIEDKHLQKALMELLYDNF